MHCQRKNDIVIFGNSLIKRANGSELSKKIVRCLLESIVRCMKVQMMPSMREKPNHIILHVAVK